MTYDPAALPSAYTPIALDKLSNMGGLGTHPVALHQVDREQIRGIRGEIGVTPGVNDSLGYVRLSDGAGKGLYVPLAALGGPSLIVNSNFDHFQRSTGTVTSTTTFNALTSFAADRMHVLPAGASVTQARSTTVPANSRSQASLLVTGAASVTTVDIGQRIRSAIVNTRGLQSLLFTAYVRNVSGAAYTPTLRVDTPAAVDDWTTPTNRLAVSLQSCADAAWTLVHYVFDPSAYTNIANGMSVYLRIPSGSSVSGDTNHVAQFDVRPGTQFMGYVPPDVDQEFLRCWEYARVYGGTAGEQMGQGQAVTTVDAYFPFMFGTPMWRQPATSVSAASHWSASNGAGTLIACTGVTGGFDSPRSTLLLTTVAAGLTAGQGSRLQANTTSARLYILAELT